MGGMGFVVSMFRVDQQGNSIQFCSSPSQCVVTVSSSDMVSVWENVSIVYVYSIHFCVSFHYYKIVVATDARQ